MKLTRVVTYPLDFVQEPAWAYAKGWVHNAPALLIEAQTDEGINGWGEAYGPAKPIAAMVENFCEYAVIGADPFRTEDLWARLYHDARDFGASSIALAAISALDIACWDIKGKALNVPVCTLLGGHVRTELECYASSVRYLNARDGQTLQDPVELATEFEAQGFNAIKMNIGWLDPNQDLQRVRRVRRSLAQDTQLMVDANHAYTSRQAVEVARKLQELDVMWFEDPLAPEDFSGLEALRERTTIALAGGETFAGRAGFQQVLTRHLLDIVLPEVGLAGGLTECKKIADMASAFGVQVTPHGYASVAGTAAAIHLAAALPFQPSPVRPNPLPFEYSPAPFHRFGDLLVEPFQVKNGMLHVPIERPGLGIEIDRNALQRRLMR